MNTELRSPISGYIKVEAQIDGSKVQPAGGAEYPRLIVPLYINVKGIEPKHRGEIFSAQFGAIQGELVFNRERISDSLPRQMNCLAYEFDQEILFLLNFRLMRVALSGLSSNVKAAYRVWCVSQYLH